MDKLLEKMLEGKSPHEINEMLVNLNKFVLNRKEHIKKYNKIRKLHAEVIDSMQAYLVSDKYDMDGYFRLMEDTLVDETPELNINFDLSDSDDITIIDELFIYKNHPRVPSITEIYLKNNRFRSADKLKILDSMKNSYVGLFKIVDADRDNGYVIYENVFTKKRVKVIDIALSTTFSPNKKLAIYTYNRIINFDGIAFATGIHCHMTSDNEELKRFLKVHKYKKCSDFARCLWLYKISKENNGLEFSYNNQYGYRR